MKNNTSSDWLYIPCINKEVEIEVHDKDKSWDDLIKQYPNFEQQLLTKEECEKILKDKEYSKILKMDGSSRNDDFFIQQYNEENKKNGYVAVFCVGRGGSYFDSDGGSRYAVGYRGVRFCRKKNKDTKDNKELNIKFSLSEKVYTWYLDDYIEIDVKNCDSHTEAFDRLSKFLLGLKAHKVILEKGEETYE